MAEDPKPAPPPPPPPTRPSPFREPEYRNQPHPPAAVPRQAPEHKSGDSS